MVANFISRMEVEEQARRFPQDGATAHTENSIVQMLNEFQGYRIDSRNLWSPRFPSLLSPDFYLCEF
jgi:hypothetical protein